MDRRTRFNEMVRQLPTAIPATVAAAKQGDEEASDRLCANLFWAAFSCPDAITTVYDQMVSAWLESDIQAVTSAGADTQLEGFPSVPIPDKLLSEFWSVIDDADKGYDATSITVRAAALAQFIDPGFDPIAEQAAAVHPGCTEPGSRAMPEFISVASLADSSPGSLVNDLHRMWVDNNFDPEVLDRDIIGLANLAPNLRYLNTRILQMHDVWHLVAGYQTTGLHEIAISSFQLSQFLHNYSANFLAAILMMAQYRHAEGFPYIFHTVAEAWKHGRETPVMMDIEWQEIWGKSTQSIRSEHGITPFKSEIPADLLEMMAEQGEQAQA